MDSGHVVEFLDRREQASERTSLDRRSHVGIALYGSSAPLILASLKRHFDALTYAFTASVGDLSAGDES
ncbi:hypothetical protein L596_013099 [Steinernema carpocapsae]|uniref:Uncharacterized protein n=1 Tax=Steinernema carpocapsae TaxID=34508 RepID=A0A4U5NZU2_STECR|nr:hypothetical protein L596_013099 [Steinernema carpocapsae]